MHSACVGYGFASMRVMCIYTRIHIHEESHHLRNERNHPNKSKVVVFAHRNDVFLYLFVFIKKKPNPKEHDLK